jgi:hypothetical protein
LQVPRTPPWLDIGGRYAIALLQAMHGACDIIVEEMRKPASPKTRSMEHVEIFDLALETV